MYIDVEGNSTAVTVACCFSLSSNFPSSVSVSEDLSSIAAQVQCNMYTRVDSDYPLPGPFPLAMFTVYKSDHLKKLQARPILQHSYTKTGTITTVLTAVWTVAIKN